MSWPHISTPQMKLQAMHLMLGHHWNHQGSHLNYPELITSSEAPRNSPPGGTSLEPSGYPSEGFRSDSPSNGSRPQKGSTSWLHSRPLQLDSQAMHLMVGHHYNHQKSHLKDSEVSLQEMNHRVCHHCNLQGIHLTSPSSNLALSAPPSAEPSTSTGSRNIIIPKG